MRAAVAAIARFASVERFLDVRPMELQSRGREVASFHTETTDGVFSPVWKS
jgi:hypothetical protein